MGKGGGAQIPEVRRIGSYELFPVLVPTNTTSTAAYVAVEMSVSIFETLTAKARIKAKSRTNVETVIRLFSGEGRIVMTSMGTTRNKPPVIATKKRTQWSINVETSFGGFPSMYSLFLWRRSSWDHVNRDGSCFMKASRRGSILASAS